MSEKKIKKTEKKQGKISFFKDEKFKIVTGLFLYMEKWSKFRMGTNLFQFIRPSWKLVWKNRSQTRLYFHYRRDWSCRFQPPVFVFHYRFQIIKCPASSLTKDITNSCYWSFTILINSRVLTGYNKWLLGKWTWRQSRLLYCQLAKRRIREVRNIFSTTFDFNDIHLFYDTLLGPVV